MKHCCLLFIGLILLSTLSGCSSISPTIEDPTQTTLLEGYPSPVENSVQTAYPAGAVNSEDTGEQAFSVTQDPNLGSVEGTLLLGGKPIANVTLYLGGVITDAQGRELVAGYDRTSVLRATTDAEGHWRVYNVPEGRYGLILDIISQAYLLNMPDGSQSVLLTVKKGEITQLGTLDYSDLPGF